MTYLMHPTHNSHIAQICVELRNAKMKLIQCKYNYTIKNTYGR